MKHGISPQELATEIERRRDAKKDLIASTKDVRLDDRCHIHVGDDLEFGVNDIAHQQIAEHVGIPKAYYDKCKAEAPALLANNVNEWFTKYPAPRLWRTLDGNARACLSDKFRPLDDADLAEAVLPPLLELGLDVHSCQITDRRLYIKAVDPKVTRELAKVGAQFGDGGHSIVRCLYPAITISNSEVGLGALSIDAGTFDGACSNLATFGERSVRKTHVGGRQVLGEEKLYELLSADTRRLTDQALWAQIGDVVKGAFNEAAFHALCDKIEGTHQDKIEGDPVKVIEVTAKRFGLNDTERGGVLKALIANGDLSRFGVHNAITRVSQDVADYDRATDLERLGAKIIELPRAEWKELAKAA